MKEAQKEEKVEEEKGRNRIEVGMNMQDNMKC